MLYKSGLGFVLPKLVLDGTVDKTWFKPDKTGQNLRKAINHTTGVESLRIDRGSIEYVKRIEIFLLKFLNSVQLQLSETLCPIMFG